MTPLHCCLYLIEATGYAVQSTLKRLEREEARQRTILARLEEAQARLDLAEARRILAEMLESFYGPFVESLERAHETLPKNAPYRSSGSTRCSMRKEAIAATAA